MGSLADLYCNEVKKRMDYYYAAWKPDSRFELGSIGIIEKNVFLKQHSLQSLSIPYEPVIDNSPSTIELSSNSGVSINFKLAGEVNTQIPYIPEMKAGFEIAFEKEGGFVFKSNETYEDEIANLLSLRKTIIQMYKDGVWDKNWAVIVKIIRAPNAFFMISETKNSKIGFIVEAKGEIGPIDIANAELNLSQAHKSGAVLNMEKSQNVTPFFMAAKLKRAWNPEFDNPIISYKSGSRLSLSSPITADTLKTAKDIPDDFYYLDIFN